MDPDLDDMTFSVSGNNQFTISINQLTSAVRVTASSCDVTEYVMFTAMDIYNATNTSNLVTLKCLTKQTADEGGAGTGTGTGGGGGF